VLSLCLIFLFLVIAAITATITKSDFSRSVIAAGIIILIPSVSYFYVLVFTFLPLLEFIKHADEFSERKKKLYTLLFLLMYSCCFLLTQCFIPQALIVILMFVSEEIFVIRQEIVPWLKARKQNI
jgi:hypothetical protein